MIKCHIDYDLGKFLISAAISFCFNLEVLTNEMWLLLCARLPVYMIHILLFKILMGLLSVVNS